MRVRQLTDYTPQIGLTDTPLIGAWERRLDRTSDSKRNIREEAGSEAILAMSCSSEAVTHATSALSSRAKHEM